MQKIKKENKKKINRWQPTSFRFTAIRSESSQWKTAAHSPANRQMALAGPTQVCPLRWPAMTFCSFFCFSILTWFSFSFHFFYSFQTYLGTNNENWVFVPIRWVQWSRVSLLMLLGFRMLPSFVNVASFRSVFTGNLPSFDLVYRTIRAGQPNLKVQGPKEYLRSC